MQILLPTLEEDDSAFLFLTISDLPTPHNKQCNLQVWSAVSDISTAGCKILQELRPHIHTPLLTVYKQDMRIQKKKRLPSRKGQV